MNHDIEAIAREVSYEWDMLRWTFEKLCYEEGELLPSEVTDPQVLTECWVGTGRDDRLRSAMLESFLLHARVLRDFLCADSKSREDDVLAADFFEAPEAWTSVRPSLGPYMQANRKRLNKALAHISYGRLDFRGGKDWDISAVLRELDLTWRAFLAALPEEHREWFWTN